jgi:hypothetical protein
MPAKGRGTFAIDHLALLERRSDLENFNRVESEFRVDAVLDVGGLTKTVQFVRDEITDMAAPRAKAPRPWLRICSSLPPHRPEKRSRATPCWKGIEGVVNGGVERNKALALNKSY